MRGGSPEMFCGQQLARELAGAAAAGGRRWRVQGLTGGAQAYFLFRLLSEVRRPSLVLVGRPADAERIAGDLRFFFGEEGEDAPPRHRRVHVLPGWEVAPFEEVSPPSETVAGRLEALYRLCRGEAPVVMATAEAVLQRVVPRESLEGSFLRLAVGDEIDRDAVVTRLVSWGYRRLSLVEDRGELSARGGIIDVFPPTHSAPVRIELEGDRIERIDAFDPVTQRSVGAECEVLLLPVSELALGRVARDEVCRAVEQRCREIEVARRERIALIGALESGLIVPGIEFTLPYWFSALGTVEEYLPADAVLWVIDPGEFGRALEEVEELARRAARAREELHKFHPPPQALYRAAAGWRRAMERFDRVEIGALALQGEREAVLEVRCAGTPELRLEKAGPQHEVTFEPVAARLQRWCAEGERVFVVTSREEQARRFLHLLAAHGVDADVARDPVAVALRGTAGRPRLLLGHLSAGFRLPDERLVFVTEADVFGEVRRRPRGRRVALGALLESLSELHRDDYVVHVDHGVGLYRGLKHLRVAGTEGDYLHLEYAGGDRLYVPVDRINLVQKYVGTDSSAPPLDRLGSSRWERVKKRTRASVFAMAKELLEIYAARQVLDRRPYSPPDGYFQQFAAAFPFEETPDQLKAIEDTLADLARPKPMDRLICGDVGYGKTEVAMRAAFLAVMDGRQVAVLVPTTVLAQQHLETFANRFDGYPVRVEMLSRFLSPKETRAVLAGLRDGTVDIVIGTHRLLQDDVEFRRLGLLIVDEEHRFGVRDKERIKKMRKLVDVLTLTATPIPRTLQMSLLGIRDLSVIETPPVDRQAVRTYVTRYDEGLIREAILRELARGGQVFFVHNRVETIDAAAERVRKLVPEATVAVAHGKMPAGKLEKVMLDFMRRRANVLVCSAIVESGLDIPNANTMIVDRADQFGLAQLYQLRGRVGRSHQRAYAYLMIPGEHLVTRDAQKRLQVLQELDELGSGFRLAARDLEIRGAGNLLGKQQSGHIAAVGFELYEQMLAEAVRELRGEELEPEVEPELQLGIPAFLPESYVPDERQRLLLYRRLAAVRSDGELAEIAAEMRDRFGPPPPQAERLVKLMDLRRRLRERRVVRAAAKGGWVTLQFHPQARVDVGALVSLVQAGRGAFRLTQDFQLRFRVAGRDWAAVVEETKSVLNRVGEL